MKNHVWTVFRKELLDILRDRKSLLLGILLPLFLYPLMFTFMGNAINGMQTEAENKTTIAIDGTQGVKEVFKDYTNLQFIESADPIKDLADGTVKVVLKAQSQPEGKFFIEIVYDDKRSDSSNSASYVQSIISEYNQEKVTEALAKQGIDLVQLSPVSYSQTTVSSATGKEDTGTAGIMLSMLLPMLVIIFLSMGGMATANDLFAGEKERKTMEPLLTTRAGRGAILTGKFIAVTGYSILTVVVSFLGMLGGYLINPSAMTMGDALGETISLKFSAAAVLLVFLLILVMALIFSGIHVSISTYARTTKEAATYGTFVMLASYVPSFAGMFMQAGDFKTWMMFVPVLNVLGSLKMVLGGVSDYVFFIGSILSSAVFLVAILLLTRWLFKKESIMLRTA